MKKYINEKKYIYSWEIMGFKSLKCLDLKIYDKKIPYFNIKFEKCLESQKNMSFIIIWA